MKVSLREVKARGLQAFASGDAGTSLRLFDKVVASAPLDAESRITGAVPQALPAPAPPSSAPAPPDEEHR